MITIETNSVPGDVWYNEECDFDLQRRGGQNGPMNSKPGVLRELGRNSYHLPDLSLAWSWRYDDTLSPLAFAPLAALRCRVKSLQISGKSHPEQKPVLFGRE